MAEPIRGLGRTPAEKGEIQGRVHDQKAEGWKPECLSRQMLLRFRVSVLGLGTWDLGQERLIWGTGQRNHHGAGQQNLHNAEQWNFLGTGSSPWCWAAEAEVLGSRSH